MPGPSEAFFCALARKHRVWLIPGSLYEVRDGSIYNTAPVIDADGEVIARYRKMFPFLPYEKGISAGQHCVVFDVPQVGRFGMSICYDMWFPETSRTLAWMGAEAIIHPTLTNTLDREIELPIARASAAINQCYFFDVNSAGRLGYGRSIIVGPEGEVIYEAGVGQEFIPIEIDLDRVRHTRHRGVRCLGQPLKSFRDADLRFPVYQQGASASPTLRELGPLTMPGVDEREEERVEPIAGAGRSGR